MRKNQGKMIIGYVIFTVESSELEQFFQHCINMGIPIWDINMLNSDKCQANVYLHHLHKVKMISKELNCEIDIVAKKGQLNNLLRLWKRKELIVSIILSSIIIFFLSNIVWKVNIHGVSYELEEKITKQLAENGLYKGAWSFSIDSLDVLQQNILHSIPELLYVGIKKRGTTYTVEVVEKLIVEERKTKPFRSLVASKNGVIKKMMVEKGQTLVSVHDYVKKGDVLVTGMITNELKENTEENDQQTSDTDIFVSAEGKIYANTWYEVVVSSSLFTNYEHLSGDKVTKYYVRLGKIDLPIWGFSRVSFDEILETKIEKQMILLKWQLPFYFVEKNLFDKSNISYDRTEEEAKSIAIQHATADLQLKLGKDSQILKYYILHETVENGKVKLKLYISAMENIAKGVPIH